MSPLNEMPPTQNVQRDGSIIGPEPRHAKGFKVIAHVHLYPPSHNAGAEWMLHALLRYGKEHRGWSVQVLTDQLPTRSDTWQGIPCRHDRNVRNLTIDYRFANVIITHLDVSRKAIDIAARQGRPVVHLIHNDSQLAYHRVQPRECALAIFNSFWLQEAVKWPGASIVMHPPTSLADYQIEPTGRKVSLLNLSEAKGSQIFYRAAANNPKIKFLGVKGAYAIQDPAPDLGNLEIMDNQSDVLVVYKETRLLVVPSSYESWGRVAVEAACSGIPSICSPTPGLLEAGVGAIFVDPEDQVGWDKAIRKLMNSKNAWEEASAQALARATELDALISQQLLDAALAIEALG